MYPFHSQALHNTTCTPGSSPPKMLPSTTGPCQTSSRSLVFGLGWHHHRRQTTNWSSDLTLHACQETWCKWSVVAVRGSQGCPGAGAAILQESQHPNGERQACVPQDGRLSMLTTSCGKSPRPSAPVRLQRNNWRKWSADLMPHFRCGLQML